MTPRRVAAAACAVGAGLSIVASQPPVSAWPLAFLAPVLLLAGIRLAAPAGHSWWVGLVAGLAAYLPMLVWLATPAGAGAWVLLATVQALALAAFAVLVRPWLRSPWLVLVAPALWTGLDAWRGIVPLGGFAWGTLAHAHVTGTFLLPVARVLGSRGVTLLTVVVATALYDLARRAAGDLGPAPAGDGGDVRDRLRAGLPRLQPAFAALTAGLLAGVLITVEPPAPTGTRLDVLAVQGNDLATTSMPAREVDRVIARNQLELTRRSVAEQGPPDLTVWPESAIDRDPYTMAGSDLRPVVDEAAALTGGGLLVGANLEGPRPGTFLNTALLVDAAGEPVDRYVKRHVVPFGEYVPWRSVLGDVGPLRRISRDAVAGTGPGSIRIGDHAVAVGICFESLFPELIRENVRADDAGVLVIATNDASFGISAEPAQHLAQSRLRAVETGRWVVHAALSGSTALVDPEGHVVTSTGLFEQATVRREIPLVRGDTPFLAVGDVVGAATRVVVVGALAWLGWLRWRAGRRDRGARA